jgi:hypothetical protein
MMSRNLVSIDDSFRGTRSSYRSALGAARTRRAGGCGKSSSRCVPGRLAPGRGRFQTVAAFRAVKGSFHPGADAFRARSLLPGTLYGKMRFLIVAAALAIAACGPSTQARSIPEYGYEVVHTYHHDPLAFTQGLFYLDGYLYEGTGLEEQSSIRKVKLETGEVVEKRDVPGEYFGEGIVNWRDRLLEITWTTHVGFIYDLLSFAPKGQFEYPGEGWGLTQDGKRIIMSDGSPELRFWDPETLKELGRLRVTADGEPVKDLNELEGRNLCQRVADRYDRPHRPSDRQGGGLDRSYQPAESRRPHRADRRPQRHRLRRQRRPAVCHGQALAQVIRD